MPARKPLSLQSRHSTNDEITAREKADESMQSEKAFSVREPADLKGHKTACKVWRRTIREYEKLEAQLVSKLDYDLLIDYCLTMEQMEEINELRESARDVWRTLQVAYRDAVKSHEVIEAKLLAPRVTDSFDSIVKLDARLDQKRKYLLTVRQSLYMTPRSRTGQAPEKKDEKDPAAAGLESLWNQPVKVGTTPKSEQGDES